MLMVAFQNLLRCTHRCDTQSHISKVLAILCVGPQKTHHIELGASIYWMIDTKKEQKHSKA